MLDIAFTLILGLGLRPLSIVLGGLLNLIQQECARAGQT